MVILNRDRVKRVFASVDWGFSNPGVIGVWAEDNDGRLYLVYQVYQSLKTIDWWIVKAKELKLHFGIEIFICDPSEPGYIQQFNSAGLYAIKANNDVFVGISKTQERLKVAADGRPRLYIIRGSLVERDESLAIKKKPICTEDEFSNYRWKDKSKKDEPVKEDDHGMDMLRYGVMYCDGGSTWVRKPLSERAK